MDYREAPPPPVLHRHVACVWAGRGHGPVLPDGCVDLVWSGQDLRVAGPSTAAFVPSGPPGGTKAGVRLRIGAAETVLGQPARELLNRSPRLGLLWVEGAEIEERCADAGSTAEQIRVLLAAVAKRVGRADAPDPVVRRAVLLLDRPDTRVAAVTGVLSERQLRRRFDRDVGYPPKVLARVLRLQRFLSLARRSPAGSVALARLAAEAGYADQAHLSREARSLTGEPPSSLLGAGAAPTGEPALTGA